MKPQRYWPWVCLRRWRGKGSGTPIVVNTGLSARVLFGRWLAGETIDEIAEDYNLHPSVVEQAFREWAGKPKDWATRVEIQR